MARRPDRLASRSRAERAAPCPAPAARARQLALHATPRQPAALLLRLSPARASRGSAAAAPHEAKRRARLYGRTMGKGADARRNEPAGIDRDPQITRSSNAARPRGHRTNAPRSARARRPHDRCPRSPPRQHAPDRRPHSAPRAGQCHTPHAHMPPTAAPKRRKACAPPRPPRRRRWRRDCRCCCRSRGSSSLSLTDPIPPAAAEHAATARMRTRTE